MSDLDRILKLASHGTADAQSQAPAERELKDVPVVEEPTTTREAVGEFAEPIYDLIDMHFEGDCQPVFDDLVRFLSGDQIKEFVDDFRRHHELPMGDDMDEAQQLNASECEEIPSGHPVHLPGHLQAAKGFRMYVKQLNASECKEISSGLPSSLARPLANS